MSSSSWIYENTSNWMQQFFVYILRSGTVPNHVAIIMDGNRRFAVRNELMKRQGYIKGFDTLARTIRWCAELGIHELTVYAFSIQNFKRTEEEVNELMDVAKVKFRLVIHEWEKLKKYGICVRVVGNLTLLRKDVLCLALIAMLLTKGNDQFCLNIAVSYTSREEMSDISRNMIRGTRAGTLDEADVRDKLLHECCYTYKSIRPEIIIRTAGSSRLSDFLTMNCSASYYHSVNVLWPEFSQWHLLRAIFLYQHFRCKLDKLNPQEQSRHPEEKVTKFSEELQKTRMKELLSLCLDVGVLDNIDIIENYSCEQIFEYYTLHIASNPNLFKISS